MVLSSYVDTDDNMCRECGPDRGYTKFIILALVIALMMTGLIFLVPPHSQLPFGQFLYNSFL